MKFGYARTSKLEQNLDLQIDELKKAGCEKIITDKISGSVAERPGLAKLKEQIRPITLAYKSCALLIDCLK